MEQSIRCAVLGLGRLGYWHAVNLASGIRGAELAAVVDPLEGRAEQVAKELGVAAWYTASDKVFENPFIDAVIIATPTSTHAEMIKKAARHGKHIFVEKPITQTLEEADEVIAEIRKHNVYCQVGFMKRFDAAYREAKRRIHAGDIGEPLYFKGISREGNVPPPSFIQHSGGIFLDVCIHDFDMARYLMDTEVSEVQASGNVLVHDFLREFGDVDQAVTLLKFQNGTAADIETMRISTYGYDIRGEIIGTDGAIQIGALRQHAIQIITAKGSLHDITPDFPTRFKDAYLQEMTHFIDSLRSNTAPSCNEWDGRAALAISIASRKSYRSGKIESVD